jgi:hypothetical protein
MAQRQTTVRRSRRIANLPPEIDISQPTTKKASRAELSIFAYIDEGNLDKVRQMIEAKPQILYATKDKKTPLQYAIDGGQPYLAATDLIISLTSDKRAPSLLFDTDKAGDYAIHILTEGKNDNYKKFDEFIRIGFDVNSESKNAFGKYTTIFNIYLLQYSLNRDYTEFDSQPLAYLISKGVKINNLFAFDDPNLYGERSRQDLRTLLSFLSVQIWRYSIPHLFVSDAKLDAIQKQIEFLLENGADPRIPTKDTKDTPLHALVCSQKKQGIPSLIDKYIEKGADINAKKEDDQTPIMAGIEHLDSKTAGNADTLIYIINIGARLDIPQRLQGTKVYPMFFIFNEYRGELARQSFPSRKNTLAKYLEIIKAMIDHGADINTTYQRWSSPQTTFMQIVMKFGIPRLNLTEEETQEYFKLLKFVLEKGISTKDPRDQRDIVNDTPEDMFIEAQEFFQQQNSSNEDEMWKGFSYEDVLKFKEFLKAENEIEENDKETLKNYSFCPVCLDFAVRQDGCMYMSHNCSRQRRNNAIYKKFSTPEKGMTWCTYCGRACQGHRHIAKFVPPYMQGEIPLAEARVGGQYFDRDCINSGGGGSNEKKQRILSLLTHACIMQEAVGTLSAQDARNQIIEAVWSDANEDADMSGNKEFDFTCFPSEISQPRDEEPERVLPDVNRPADEKDLVPIKHDNGDCIIEGGPHDDHRPTWEFVHKQPDGTVYHHTNYICGEDLEEFLKTRGPQDATFGMCWEPTACRARLYPEEIKDIVSAPFYDVYKRNFNARFSEQQGGATENFMHPVDLDSALCARSDVKKAGKRRITRRKRRGTKKYGFF